MRGQVESGMEDYERREKLFVRYFLLAVCLTLAHFVHSSWFMYFQASLKTPASSTLYAPEAYRVMMPMLWHFLSSVFAMKNPAWVAAALDGLFGYAALWIFYRLTIQELPTQPEERQGRQGRQNRQQRLIVVALYLAMIQFPINWIVPWQRPETMPTSLFLALALFCLARSRRSGTWLAVLLAATVFQSFVRADVPFVFGAALFILSFAGATLQDFGSRAANAMKGALMVVIAGSVQGYLQFVRYPHLSYTPGTSVVQLRDNLLPHNLLSLTLALLPFLLLAVAAFKTRARLNSVESLTIAAALLYLPIWLTVGSAGEVRIFVPFLLALCVVAARVFASCFNALEAA
ncbi:MAG: hypothetical protein ABI197_03035 [Granulicella sp.]